MNKKYCLASDRIKIRSQIKQLITKYKHMTKHCEENDQVGPQKQKEIFQIINCIGMKYAKDGYLQQAESWLTKAEPATKLFPKLKIILHSNLACIYKKKPDFEKALEHIHQAERTTQALRLLHHENFQYDSLLIDCWLNLTALLSSQKKHEEALSTVRGALALINFEKGQESLKCNQQHLIGKYNQAVELEYLGRLKQAYGCIEQAKRFMNIHKIYGHFLQKSFSQLHQQLRKKLLSQAVNNRKTLNIQVSDNQGKSSLKNILKTENKQSELIGYKTERSSIKPNAYYSQKYNSIDKINNTISNQNSYNKTIIKISFTPVTARGIMQEIKNK